MSASSSGKSHGITWTVIVIAIPLLYLLSVAPLMAVMCRPKLVEFDRSIGPGWAVTTLPPAWLEAYMVPYDWLVKHTFAEQPLGAYMNWVLKLAE
jgi:hypothetical protein